MSFGPIFKGGFDADDGRTIAASTCTECEGVLETTGGETSCHDCGLIVDEYYLDHAAEPFSQPGEETSAKRTGAPLTPARHDRGLSSEIGWRKDGQGNTLSGRQRRRLGRLRTHHTRAKWRSTAEQNLSHACGEIARLTSALDLPRTIREAASVIYRRAQNEDLIRGRSIESVAAASVYAACRCDSYTRTIKEIVAVTSCRREEIRHAYGVLNVELGLEAVIRTPSMLIPKLASTCNVSERVQYRALELSSIAKDAGVANGRSPTGVAAGCLYLAARECHFPLTQTRLADLVDISTVTIRDRYRELEAILEDE